jgi:tRNA 2-thiouridine synthesizing protein A
MICSVPYVTGFSACNVLMASIQLDLRGIKCPLNWAHAKVRLEQMERGQVLELTLDDPRGYRDIPRAAEAEGYAILASDVLANGTFVLKIEK